MEKTNYLNKKMASLLILGCWLVYVVAYIGRLNYAASMVGIIADLNLSKGNAGTITSFFATVYGIGQLVNGILSKHYNPKYVVTGAVLVAAMSNVAMPLVASAGWQYMAAVWLINGAAQSVLWSLLIRTLSVNIMDKDIGKAIYVMSTPAAAGTAMAYGISALFIKLGNWRLTFFIAGGLMVAVAVVWVVFMHKIETSERVENTGATADEADKNDASSAGVKTGVNKFFILSLVIISVTAIANGFIKDGVNTWVPSLLKEGFNVDDSLSVVLTLLLPIFAVFGAVVSRLLYNKLKNHVLLDGILYVASVVLILGIILLYPLREEAKVLMLVITMVLFIGVSCLMSAINNVITSMYPLDNRYHMDSGLLAGGLDTVCYVGGALAGVGLGKVADSHGWESVLILLAVFAAVSAVVSFVFYICNRVTQKGK